MKTTSLPEQLKDGVRIPSKSANEITYRYLSSHDDVDAITEMLHAAYAPLRQAGMNFLASHQTPNVTKSRLARGETIVALDGREIVGIVTLAEAAETRGSALYNRPDVASFGQFAVRPSHQGRGIGSRLLELVERRAAEKGVAELALDTSERAVDLVAFYESRGYRFVEYVQWDVTNYRSKVFAKRLTP